MMRLLNWICGLCAAWAAVYFVALEPPFLSYQKVPFPVLTPIVKPGEPVLLSVARCSTDTRHRMYPIAHRLVPLDGGRAILLAPSFASIEPGCHTSTSSINVVPKHTPPGRYRVEGHAETQGTIRTALAHWSSDEFEVVP